ncbi:MAG: DUF58 domain-containing protein, partial [Pseudomonadota bacterium]
RVNDGIRFSAGDPSRADCGVAQIRGVGVKIGGRGREVRKLTGYLTRLAERKAELESLCAVAGWRYGLHHTDHTAQQGLLWLWRALDGGRVQA